MQLQQKTLFLQCAPKTTDQTLSNVTICRSRDVKLARKRSKRLWHAWARVRKTQIIQFSLSCLFIQFLLSRTSFSPCVWSSLVLPSFRSDPCLFSSLLTLLLLLFLFSPPGLAGQYRGVFLSFCRQFSQRIFAVFPSASRSPPLSSHFHAAHWAAVLCVFIAVCGRGGGPLSATNGLLENTDSYASPCGEVWGKREKGKDLEGRLRDGSFEESPLKEIRLTQRRNLRFCFDWKLLQIMRSATLVV